MLDRNDPHYGALLIEQARLHLGTVMAGQDSEPFKAYVWAKVAAANGQAEEAQAIYDLSVLQLEDDDVPKAEVLVQQCLATQSTDCPQ